MMSHAGPTRRRNFESRLRRAGGRVSESKTVSDPALRCGAGPRLPGRQGSTEFASL
jgi:hypothetical protein